MSLLTEQHILAVLEVHLGGRGRLMSKNGVGGRAVVFEGGRAWIAVTGGRAVVREMERIY